MPVSRERDSNPVRRLKWTAAGICIVLALIGAVLGLRGPALHQYEYQEDVYLSLDGSASVYVSASLPALVALYGFDLPVDPIADVDRAKIRQAFSGPGVSVGAISVWRRHGRRFVTVRLDTRDIRTLPETAPFRQDSIEFRAAPLGYRFAERLGQTANKPIPPVGWNGRELVGFRWHIPSRVEGHNTLRENFLRGNILVWEQPLRQRLAGVPLEMWVDMQGRSILYSALWLFAVSAVSAIAVVVLIVWWVVGKGKKTKTVVSRQ